MPEQEWFPEKQTLAASVIIAAYNAEAYVGDAIASAQAQTLGNCEIIVVDDASKDGTREIVEAYAANDPRVCLVTLPVNGGPGRARNAGLARASGEWITTLDADDTYDPHRLEGLIALAEATGADMVADNIWLRSTNACGTLLPRNDRTWSQIDTVSYIVSNKSRRRSRGKQLGFLKPMIRRSFLQRTGVAYREIRLAEDLFLSLECLMHGALWIVTDVPMYHYTIREGSLTATFTPHDLDAMTKIARCLVRRSEVQAQATLKAALADYAAAVRRAATWTRFVEAVRARDLRAAAGIAFASAQAAWDIVRESAIASLRLVSRRWAQSSWSRL